MKKEKRYSAIQRNLIYNLTNEIWNRDCSRYTHTDQIAVSYVLKSTKRRHNMQSANSSVEKWKNAAHNLLFHWHHNFCAYFQIYESITLIKIKELVIKSRLAIYVPYGRVQWYAR